jgi:quercetin dioxygenase-like cupin family protein
LAIIHKLTSNHKNDLTWDGARTRSYSLENGKVIESWLIGKAEKAENFALRYYKLGLGMNTRKECHAHDHGIIIMHGKALIILENEQIEAEMGDVVYISSDEEHQLRNIGDENLGFMCIIPAKRMKNNNEVWAETGLFEDE